MKKLVNLLKNKKKLLLFILFFLFLFTMYFFVYSFIEYFYIVVHPITDINKYNKEVNGKLLKVFPNEIPSTAKNVYFLLRPSFLQGGEQVILYYVDESLNIDEFNDKYNKKAKWVGYVGNYPKNSNLIENCFFSIPFELKNENDFKIYLVEGWCDDSGYCNHGRLFLTAINEKTFEVIYKYEDW